MVDAPPAAELFDAALPSDAKRRADAPDAWCPRPVARAHEHLEKHSGARAWKPIAPPPNYNFATSGWSETTSSATSTSIRRWAFSRVMTGIETELAGLVSSLETLRDALPPRGSPLRVALTDELRAAPRLDDGRPAHLTLGSYVRLLERLARGARRPLDQQGLASVVSLGEDTKWLTDTKLLRDPASHKDYEAYLPAIRTVLFKFFDSKGREAERIVAARGAVKGRVKDVKMALERR